MDKILKRVENIFLIICLTVGFIFIAINPPFQVSDENSHFFKMYAITEGSFNFKKYTMDDGKTYAASVLPSSITFIAKDANNFIGRYDMKYSYNYINFISRVELKKDKTSTFIYYIPSYGILSYMPGIIVLEMMKWLNIPPLCMMYVLRIVSLLTYALICYFAIRIVPVKKWLFMLCALLPISVYSAGGISTDGIVTSLCFLYTAYIFNLAFNGNIKEISKKDFIVTFLIIMYITICKFPYGVLALLLFVIPKEKFPKKFSRCKTFFITVAVLSIYVLLNYFYNSMITKGLTSPNHEMVSSKDAFIFAIQNPLHVISALLTTVKISIVKWYVGTVALFGWSDTYIPIYDSLLMSLIIIISSFFTDKEEITTEITRFTNKIIYFLITALFTIGTLAVCYLLFSYADFNFIHNMQGRYLVPLTPLIYLLFASKIKINFKPLKVISLIFYIFLILECCVNIINRFY